MSQGQRRLRAGGPRSGQFAGERARATAGSTPCSCARCRRQRKSRSRWSTTDKGSRKSGREQIFRPFQRQGDRDNATGLGLGLAVARGLAEGMEGQVHAEHTPGGGATMVFTLPISEERT
ncbi:sensor histidine kinase [Glutamicibacter halophytocola]|uniref:sensor histidine kinase n=1 Tax=Glutamicibacter halophytocola TaxID=1933880 RepID=UPI003D2C2E02